MVLHIVACMIYILFWLYLMLLVSPYVNMQNKVRNIKPGWNDFVAEQHSAAREAFKFWSHTNAKLKYALCFIKTNENTMRADSVVGKLEG